MASNGLHPRALRTAPIHSAGHAPAMHAADPAAETYGHPSYQQLLDALGSVADGLLLFDRDDRLVYKNPAADLLVAEPGALTPGMSFEDYIWTCVRAGRIADANGCEAAWVADRLARHRRAEGVAEQQHADGRWLRISENRTRDGGTVSVYADITAVKRREQAERNTAALLRATLDNTTHGITVVDSDYKLVLWNRRACEVLDLPLELFERPGVGLEDVLRFNANRGDYGPGDPEEQVRARMTLARRNEAHEFERTRPDGTTLLVSGKPLPGGGFVTLYSDVTAWRQAERALRESHDRYSKLVEALSEGIAIYKQGEICFVNEAGARILGAGSPEQLLGRRVIDFVAESHRPLAREGTTELLRTGQRVSSQALDLLTLDGKAVPCEVEAARYIDGGETAVQVVFRDVTERRQSEQELRGARDAAEAANRAKSEFLANMSHELRTPLNAVIGFAEIMAGEMLGSLAPRYREYAQDIRESGNHLLSLINDILDLSKAEAGKLELREERCRLSDLVESCLRLLRERARRSDIELAILLDWDPVLEADPRLMKQVLLNLVSNALKFTTEGGRVSIRSRRLPDSALAIEIADTGIGIAPENLRRIMEPFQQVDSALSRKYGGTGLGLPLARTMLELHGGALTLESAEGVGTTASVVLPATRIVS